MRRLYAVFLPGLIALTTSVSFSAECNYAEALQKALNTHLPQDMAVREIRMAADDFHPRFDASSRHYRYRLFCAGVRDPLRERYAWRVWPAVTDLTSLANVWLGRHDFGAFGTSPQPGDSTVRTVVSAIWQQQSDEWIFEIQADAFLYRMVRRLVYAQVAVGQARLSANALALALDDKSGNWPDACAKIPASLAPACGLTLVEVRYDNLV